MKSRSIRRYAGALLCTAPAIAAAQQTAFPAPELDSITVTAQRVPTDGRTLPVSISVITAEDIAASSARTMQDLLSIMRGPDYVGYVGQLVGYDARDTGRLQTLEEAFPRERAPRSAGI